MYQITVYFIQQKTYPQFCVTSFLDFFRAILDLSFFVILLLNSLKVFLSKWEGLLEINLKFSEILTKCITATLLVWYLL